MADFEVEFTVRNNQLKRRRTELGRSQHQLAEEAGISLGEYNALERMRRSPVTKRGQWTQTARRLADFHGLPPEELFPAAVRAVRKSRVKRLVDVEDLRYALPSTEEELND